MATKKGEPLAERFAEAKGRAKFDAWSKVKGMAKDEAMKRYVALVDALRAELG